MAIIMGIVYPVTMGITFVGLLYLIAVGMVVAESFSRQWASRPDIVIFVVMGTGLTGGALLGTLAQSETSSGAILPPSMLLMVLWLWNIQQGDQQLWFSHQLQVLGASGIWGGAFGIGFWIGFLRIPFYLFQFLWSLVLVPFGISHPVLWDELVTFPLPRTRRALFHLLTSEKGQVKTLGQLARNRYRRWAVQSALSIYLHSNSNPLRALYELSSNPVLEEYAFLPVAPLEWERGMTLRGLFLAEIGLRFVNTRQTKWEFEDRLAWWLTLPLRDRRKTPLTRFADMLFELLDEDVVNAQDFELSSYHLAYGRLTRYPGGVEIARSFEAMAIFLSCSDMSTLSAAPDMASRLQFGDQPIRPAVVTALTRLGGVGIEIAAYRNATSRVNKLAALARASNALDNLNEYVVAEVAAPEQHILRRIIHQWQRLVIETGGRVGRAEAIDQVANPYVLNNPVQGNIFVGREDVMRRLGELWSGEGQKPSIVLYGHRRMGKSSILHNLGARFGMRTVIVNFNMQRVGLVASTNELLHNLALALYDGLPTIARRKLEGGEPAEEHFTGHNPYTSFDRFLKQLDVVRAGRRFIVTVDEFELIEQGITEGQLEARLLDFWRGLIQTYPWFVMVFAGLHTLQEMTRDYWHPLFGSVTGIPVSFLGHDAAWRLITQPTPDFPLDYDTGAVEGIIALTHGQPYLMQLIGHGLVTRFNRQTFEEDIERERRFALADVEAVIGAPEFYRDGNAYFTGVWVQAEKSEPHGQTTVLRALARSEAGMPVEEIARNARQPLEDTQRALEALKNHDVVMQEDECWKFTVELMRRWVAQRE